MYLISEICLKYYFKNIYKVGKNKVLLCLEVWIFLVLRDHSGGNSAKSTLYLSAAVSQHNHQIST